MELKECPYEAPDATPESYLDSAWGCLVCYSVLSSASFDQAKAWLAAMPDTCVVKLLIGTHVDKARFRRVDRQAAEKLSEELGLYFMEVSSTLGTNIQLTKNILRIRTLFAGKRQARKERERVRQREREREKQAQRELKRERESERRRDRERESLEAESLEAERDSYAYGDPAPDTGSVSVSVDRMGQGVDTAQGTQSLRDVPSGAYGEAEGEAPRPYPGDMGVSDEAGPQEDRKGVDAESGYQTYQEYESAPVGVAHYESVSQGHGVPPVSDPMQGYGPVSPQGVDPRQTRGAGAAGPRHSLAVSETPQSASGTSRGRALSMTSLNHSVAPSHRHDRSATVPYTARTLHNTHTRSESCDPSGQGVEYITRHGVSVPLVRASIARPESPPEATPQSPPRAHRTMRSSRCVQPRQLTLPGSP
ncbi:small GTPase superfamily, Rab type, partial [Kipferlia bialata]|eukprot:g5323.t1